MATSAVTATVNAFPNGRELTLNKLRAYGTLAVGAGSYVANGLPVSFVGLGEISPADASSFLAGSRADSDSSGYVYRLDATHQTLRIFVTGTAAGDPLNELGVAAVPTGVTGDTINFVAIFNRGT